MKQGHGDDPSRGNNDALALFHAPLLREGSHLVDAQGQLKRQQAHHGWMLMMDSPEAGAPGYELTVLPCTRLAEMIRILESTPNQRVTFQVTGKVLVYRNRNYVLPSHAAVLTEHSGATSKPGDDNAAPEAVAPPTSSERSDTGKSDHAEDIIKDLEQTAGAIARSSAPSPTDAAVGASSSRRDQPDSTSVPDSATTKPDRVMQENTSIAGRRGKLSRDSAGGWVFVFDADASGLADPPMRLIPCLLLEKIEDYARRMGNNSPALLSGAIYLYNGQNFLLPTVFRIPQDRRNLTP